MCLIHEHNCGGMGVMHIENLPHTVIDTLGKTEPIFSSGERTLSHFAGQNADRFTMLEMYRRNPINHPGPVAMKYGRPGDGYYAQKYPCTSLLSFNVRVHSFRNEYPQRVTPKVALV